MKHTLGMGERERGREREKHNRIGEDQHECDDKAPYVENVDERFGFFTREGERQR